RKHRYPPRSLIVSYNAVGDVCHRLRPVRDLTCDDAVSVLVPGGRSRERDTKKAAAPSDGVRGHGSKISARVALGRNLPWTRPRCAMARGRFDVLHQTLAVCRGKLVAGRQTAAISEQHAFGRREGTIKFTAFQAFDAAADARTGFGEQTLGENGGHGGVTARDGAHLGDSELLELCGRTGSKAGGLNCFPHRSGTPFTVGRQDLSPAPAAVIATLYTLRRPHHHQQPIFDLQKRPHPARTSPETPGAFRCCPPRVEEIPRNTSSRAVGLSMLLVDDSDQPFLDDGTDQLSVPGVDHSTRQTTRALSTHGLLRVQQPFIGAERAVEPHRVV